MVCSVLLSDSQYEISGGVSSLSDSRLSRMLPLEDIQFLLCETWNGHHGSFWTVLSPADSEARVIQALAPITEKAGSEACKPCPSTKQKFSNVVSSLINWEKQQLAGACGYRCYIAQALIKCNAPCKSRQYYSCPIWRNGTVQQSLKC